MEDTDRRLAGAEQEAGNDNADLSGKDVQEQDPRKELKYSDEDLDKIFAKKIARERERTRKLLHESDLDEDLKKREKNITRREIEFDYKLRLEDEQLPLKLAKFIDYSSSENAEKSYTELTDFYKETIQELAKDYANRVIGARQKDPLAGANSSRNAIDAAIDKIFKEH